MSSFCKCKSYSHFFSENISVNAIFNDQSFNDTLNNDIVSFEKLAQIFMLNAVIYWTRVFTHIFYVVQVMDCYIQLNDWQSALDWQEHYHQLRAESKTSFPQPPYKVDLCFIK